MRNYASGRRVEWFQRLLDGGGERSQVKREDAAVLELIDQARAGDGEAFRHLVEPHRAELRVHCYRMLGSVQDAEDALQETLLAAWQGLRGFSERASLRTWLYRVATSRCLNMLRAGSRRPRTLPPTLSVTPPEPTRLGEVLWLEPYPDNLLDELADSAPGPEARYEAREAIALAFVTALQLLPPRQRAVLILRDVLGFHAAEVARILAASEESVTSALKRARAALRRRLPADATQAPPPPPGSRAEQELVARLSHAFETGDVAGIIALLSADAWVRMPPSPLEYHGPAAGRFFTTVGFPPDRVYRLLPTRANGQPALGMYRGEPGAPAAPAHGLLVLMLAGDKISAITRFDGSLLPRFGLPETFPIRSVGSKAEG